MPSIFIIKEKLENPKEWCDCVMSNQCQWEYDDILKKYHTGNIYLLERENEVAFEDMAEEGFFGWDTESWIKVADGKELLYGYYFGWEGCSGFFEVSKLGRRGYDELRR